MHETILEENENDGWEKVHRMNRKKSGSLCSISSSTSSRSGPYFHHRTSTLCSVFLSFSFSLTFSLSLSQLSLSFSLKPQLFSFHHCLILLLSQFLHSLKLINFLALWLSRYLSLVVRPSDRDQLFVQVRDASRRRPTRHRSSLHSQGIDQKIVRRPDFVVDVVSSLDVVQFLHWQVGRQRVVQLGRRQANRRRRIRQHRRRRPSVGK